ncbi:MAG: S-layer homology domain-containing protein [Oscillospiraceae bacterium]
MRNLKRVLALAMALVLTLGMMVIGANAASYTDAAQIDADYSEAIDVLTGMGVFQGQGNGVFAPKAILTRAEASALIYRVLTGDVTDAKKDLYDYSSFDDVKEGQWYTGYITYAANGGYIKGYGDGKFGLNDKVTGVQVLAIMLRAIGYGQKGEYEGAGWKDNVLTDAFDNGMLTGIATNDLDKGATRELVAQLLFNAITKPAMVTYTPALGYNKVTLGNGSNFPLVLNPTLGYKVFGLTSKTSYVIGNAATGEACTKLGAYGAASTGAKFAIDTTLAQFGHQFKVWYNENATNTAGAYNVIYATYDQATNSSITSTAYANLTDAAKRSYVATSAYHDDFTAAAAATGATAAPATYNVVVNNADGTKALVGIYLTIDQYTAINNYATTKTVTFGIEPNAITVPQAIVDGFADLNLGAYVNMVTVVGTDGSNAAKAAAGRAFYKYNVSALDTTVGTVSYVDASTGAITLNGSVVGKSYLASTSATAYNPLTIPSSWTFGTTYMVYTDLLGNYVGAVRMVNTSYLKATYAYFTHDNVAGTVKYFVQGVDVNGAAQTVQLSSKVEYDQVVATGVAHVDYNSNMIVAATTTKTSLILVPSATVSGAYDVEHSYNDGDCAGEGSALAHIANMDTVANITNQADVTATTSTISMGTSSNYFFTNSTKFIFVSGYGENLTITVKTGLADLIGENASYTITKNAVVAYHQVYSASIGTTNYAVDSIIISGIYAPNLKSNLIYIPGTGNYYTDTASKLGDNAKGEVYDAYVNGTKAAEGITVAAGTTVTKNTFYTYTVSNGVYTLTPITSVPNTPVTCNSGALTHAAGTSTDYVIVNSTQYPIASNAVIVNLTGNANAPATAYDTVISAETNSVVASVEIVGGTVTVVYLTSIS